MFNLKWHHFPSLRIPGQLLALLLCCSFVLHVQDLPKEEKIKVDEVQVTPVTKHVTAFRSICTQRLKFEIEYGLKRGTTDNSYLIQVYTYTATETAVI